MILRENEERCAAYSEYAGTYLSVYAKDDGELDWATPVDICRSFWWKTNLDDMFPFFLLLMSIEDKTDSYIY